jgi:putative NADPH-quinone reductase
MLSRLSAVFSALHPRPSPLNHVLVVNGHPDPHPTRFSAALCAAYSEGAAASGHKTRQLNVGAVPSPGAESDHLHWLQYDAANMLERLWRADRLFIAFPMWLGGPPPALKLILEELARWQHAEAKALDEPLEGKDADIVVTASFPGLVYSSGQGVAVGAWAQSLSALRSNGVMVIGNMDLLSADDRTDWLTRVRQLGASA